MPDPATLKVGDKVRIVAVPKGDLELFESGQTYLEEVVQVLKWMVGKEFVVEFIDADGKPWLDVAGYPCPQGAEHTMALMDSESWERVE